MLEVEKNTPVDAAVLTEFFARCGWQETRSAAELEWVLAASEEWVVARLEGQLIGFGRSCRLDALNRVVFDAMVDPRFAGSGLRAAIVRLLTQSAGRLERVSVFDRWKVGIPVPPSPAEAYLGKHLAPGVGEE
jgi:hypothetical protein